jgi:CheY-like chemotaxis protein
MSDKILVVDDSAFVRRVIIRSLPEDWKGKVTEAQNGVQAIEQIKSCQYRIIFLDLTMPEKDGFEVLKEMQGQLGNAVLLVVSADIQNKAKEICLQMGAADFIEKPVQEQKIIAALQKQGLL